MVGLVDESLRRHGDLGAYGDLSGGVAEIVKDNDVTITDLDSHLHLVIAPVSNQGHDFSFQVDKRTLAVANLAVGQVLPPPIPAGSPAPAAAKAAAEAPLTLLAGFDPPRLAAGDLQDVVLRLQLVNSGSRPVAVYPGAALFSAEVGWGSPTWHLEPAGSPPDASLVSLRSHYGPPGHPPAASCFAPHRRVLAPGARHEELVPGCFIPARALDADSLSPSRLDPRGYDAFAVPPAGTAVLLLHRNCAWVRDQMKQRPDFLRPGLFLLIPKPGPVRLEVQYRQQPWMGFRPERSLSAKTTAALEREP